MFRRLLQRLLTLTFVSLLFSSTALATCADLDPEKLMNPVSRLFIFERVWVTVEREYIYENYGGLDWGAAKGGYRSHILSADTNADFYGRMDDMILDLQDQHSVYLSPWDSCDEDDFHAGALDDEVPNYLPTVSRLDARPDVVYIDIPTFDSAQVPGALDEQFRQNLGADKVSAVIIDLRHNYGGYLRSAYQVLGQFAIGKLGFEYDAHSEYPVVQRKGLYYNRFKDVPVIVLVNEHTHSAAEIVAGVLQAERNATVVGASASAGNTEMLLPFDYRDGSRLWLAVGGFKLRSGHNLEGVGVVPDVLVEHALTGLEQHEAAQGEAADAVLEAALQTVELFSVQASSGQ